MTTKTCVVPSAASAKASAPKPAQLENRGMAWMIGAFVFCPCHLPITLGALALILGGTAAGALLRAHPYVAGLIVTLLWAAGTWRGYSLIRSAREIVSAR
jgi:cytochrome c biogenesis protein CcdA